MQRLISVFTFAMALFIASQAIAKNCGTVIYLDGRISPVGSVPQPLPGPRSDIRIDFDVFNEKGVELSERGGKPSKPVYSGQKVKTSLEMMVENKDVKDFLRDSKPNGRSGLTKSTT